MNQSLWRRLLPLLTVFALFAAACSSGGLGTIESEGAIADTPEPTGIPEPTETPEPTTIPEPTATPEPTPTPVPSLEELITIEIDQFMETNGIPALSLGVNVGGEDALAIARGVSNIQAGTEATVDDYYRIGSITKTVTATVMMQMVQEGLLDLDATVTSYLGPWAPGYEYENVVTVRQLLNHTSGFIEFAFDLGFYAQTLPRLGVAYEPQEIVDYSAGKAALFEPGTEYSYTTTGFVAAGMIIEAITGNPAVDEIVARVFEPAGLMQVFLPPQTTPPTEAITGYNRGALGTAIESLGLLPDEASVPFNDEVYADLSSLPQEAIRSAGWTGGGIEAVPLDGARMFRGLFVSSGLTEETIAEMTAPTLDTSYGLGVSVDVIDGLTVYTHGGGVPGFRSYAAYVPEYDMALLFSSNLIPYDLDVGALADIIIPLIVADQS